MKCITLMEPFGTLIALGEKKIETRSWKTNYRGKLAIHVSKNINKEHKIYCLKNEYIEILGDKHIVKDEQGMAHYKFNFGHIIATCDLVDCIKMKELCKDYAILDNGMKVAKNEFIFGDYNVGRYAWLLDNIKILENPIEVKGQLGLWSYDNI